MGLSVSPDEGSPDSTPPARALRSMQTGQNSIPPENSLPQLGQVRWGSVLTDLTSPGCDQRFAKRMDLVDLCRRMPAAPSEDVESIPIEPAQPGQSGLPPLHL